MSVTKGLLLLSLSWEGVGGGRWGSRKALSESGNSNASLGFGVVISLMELFGHYVECARGDIRGMGMTVLGGLLASRSDEDV